MVPHAIFYFICEDSLSVFDRVIILLSSSLVRNDTFRGGAAVWSCSAGTAGAAADQYGSGAAPAIFFTGRPVPASHDLAGGAGMRGFAAALLPLAGKL